MNTIALDLGGTRIKIGIVSEGTIVCSTMVDAFSDKGLLQRLPVVEESIAQMLDDAHISLKEVLGVGISMPGLVDTINMRLLSVNEKYIDAINFDFRAWAKDKWGLPLVIENDARSALAGEWQHGAGKGFDNLGMVTLGTGIGGATVIEGKLLRGKHFQAGCLPGHFTVNYHGDTCNCGNIGCVESEASSWRLPELAARHPKFRESKLSQFNEIDYKLVFELAEEGDNVAKDLIRHSLEVWSAGIITMIHAYDPEVIIIGGGIMKSGEKILPFIQERVNSHAWTPWGKVRVVPAQNPEWAALQGVDYLVRTQVN